MAPLLVPGVGMLHRTDDPMFSKGAILDWIEEYYLRAHNDKLTAPTEYKTAYLIGQEDLCRKLMDEVSRA